MQTDQASTNVPTLFVRNATGLVRELSAFDAFTLVFSAVLIPVGITQVMGFAPQFWPHANMFVSFLIATPLVACFGLVYLYFTTLMPRSGGDYVWVSRTLSPFLGFVVNFSLTFVFLTWVAFNFTFMLSIVLPALGYVAGIHGKAINAPSNGEMMAIATVLTILFAGLMILGVRVVARYMKITFALVWIGMAIWLILMLVYKYYGYKFFGSVVWLGLGGGTSHNTLSFAPYLPQMVKFLPGGQVLGVIVVACFLLAIFWWTPTGFLLGTRNLFAWSFDRLAPGPVTDVSDRFHTPIVATVVVALVVELLNYLNIYQGLGAFLLNIIVIMGLAFIVVSIAAGSVPFRRAAMHAEAPAWARARVLGVPVITLVAFVSAVSWAFVIYTALHTGFGGKLGWGPMLKVFAAPAVAVVWYVGVSLYRRSQGISLTNTFKEIPPE